MTEPTPGIARCAATRGPRRSIFEIGAEGSSCTGTPALDVPEVELSELLGQGVRRTPPVLPQVTELELMRHYAHLAEMNFGVDTGFYPLGSCTMKYNPRVAEDMARLPGFAGLHCAQPLESAQGALQLMVELGEMLAEISGLPAVTLQPSAGAHGELAALMVIRAALEARGDARTVVLIPDTAHGTNPATVSMCGYETRTIPSGDDGLVDLAALEAELGEHVAALMLTNPNTLGLFERRIDEITAAVHAVGAYAYCDGANLNAVLGVARPGDMGFDALHINLHKTFATPHGGGGPGSGPVCVAEELRDFLPGPIPVRLEDGTFGLDEPLSSIGRVKSGFGNFGVLVRAYAYILAVGGEGLREVAEQAVLSANYLKQRLKDSYELPHSRPCMHEFVLSGSDLRREHGVRTLDVAKRLLDYGFHPPTVYFPLVVEEALMIEPTETEPLDQLDAFADAMLSIAEEAERDPELVKGAPYSTPVRRLDEVKAAREPRLRWQSE